VSLKITTLAFSFLDLERNSYNPSDWVMPVSNQEHMCLFLRASLSSSMHFNWQDYAGGDPAPTHVMCTEEQMEPSSFSGYLVHGADYDFWKVDAHQALHGPGKVAEFFWDGAVRQGIWRRAEAILLPAGVICRLTRKFCEASPQKEQADTDDLESELAEISNEEEQLKMSDNGVKAKRVKSTHQPLPIPDDLYPAHLWLQSAPSQPGCLHFNAAAHVVLQEAASWRSPSLGSVELQQQQHIVACLLHPRSPVKRLLVDHSTGSGKTLLMLRIFDNYYFDPRPKIAVFPKNSVCENFYKTLLEWPSRMRDYFSVKCSSEANILANAGNWRLRRTERWDLSSKNDMLQHEQSRWGCSLQKVLKDHFVDKVRTVLEMKGAFRSGKLSSKFLQMFWDNHQDDNVHPPAAPLRAYRFTSAGGCASQIINGEPRSSVFKIGFDRDDGNPYSNKIVVMDEGHHLTRPDSLYKEQLEQLRQYIQKAKNIVLAVCTGTIGGNSVADARTLLDAVKGEVNARSNDEGFLSSHHLRGSQYAKVYPAGVNDGALCPATENELVCHVELTSHILVRYLYQQVRHFRGSTGNLSVDRKLANYTNMHLFYSCVHHATHEILNCPSEYAPKFAKVAELVTEAACNRRKSVVMVAKRTGYACLHELLRKEGRSAGFRIAEYAQLADYNSSANAYGQEYGVLLLDTDTAGSEGVDLKCVRLHIFVDVPWDFTTYQQRAGRSVRAGGHFDLCEDEREVRYVMLVAQLPDYARTKLGAFVLWAFAGEFGKAVPRSYDVLSEPGPVEFEDSVRYVLDFFRAHRITSPEDVVLFDATLLSELPAKLKTRLQHSLNSELCTPCWHPLSTDEAELTADERLLVKLRHGAKTLAPAVLQMQELAVDNGLYTT
jgi:hypothetical protein